MPVSLLPNSELVAMSYISSINGLQCDVVATQLPSDNTQWAKFGAIIVSVAGGVPDVYVPVAHPIVVLDFFACNPGSNKPPWFKANALAEQVRASVYDKASVSRVVPITAGGVAYPYARVLTAFLLTEPRRKFGDTGDYAIYTCDLALSWHAMTTIPESY